MVNRLTFRLYEKINVKKFWLENVNFYEITIKIKDSQWKSSRNNKKRPKT